MKRKIFFMIGLWGFFCALSFAQDTPAPKTRRVSAIDIKGIKVVSKGKVVSQIKTRIGQAYNENIISEDIKRIYSLGYFDNISTKLEDYKDGVKVIFIVKEKPILKKIEFSGNRRLHKKRILKDLKIKEGNFIDNFQLKEAVDDIKTLYYKRGFTKVKVDYDLAVDKNNQAQVTFKIKEFKRIKIKKVAVEGNDSFRSRRILKLLKTKPAWLFRSGFFDENTVKDDIKRVEDFYRRHGYSDVKVSYTVEMEKRRGLLYVVFHIKEGRQYSIGKVEIKGNKKIPIYTLEGLIKLKEGDVYNPEEVRNTTYKIQQVYIDQGYIFAQVKPVYSLNPKTGKVDIVYEIQENNLVYVNRIKIVGNVKTRDKVIRRELKIEPGERFDGEKIRKSEERLKRLGFFEEVKFDTEPTGKKDWQDLVVRVKEAKTGSFSFGGGYSSVDEFVGFVQIRQKNFDYKNFPYFSGGGQDLSLYAQSGSNNNEYALSFTNPWIFDRPISFGFDIYRREHERESDVGYGYNEVRKGGRLRFGKEFNDYLKGSIAYRFETVDISDVNPDATDELKKETGENDISSLEITTSWDKRDNAFFPRKGYYLNTSLENAGTFLGGDKDFVKFYSRLSYYLPVFRKAVVEFKARVGLAKPVGSSDDVPIYERFFAGGAYTIRGYNERKVGPIDPVSSDPIGGESMFIGNVEYTYPLNDYLKMACFFDTGNVWSKYSDFMQGDLMSSFGFGVRVKTPFGPIKVDYGIPLDVEPGEDSKSGKFHFSVSKDF